MTYFREFKLKDETDSYYLLIDSDGKIISKSEQLGQWDITDITGTISLPTGASTEATLNNFKIENNNNLINIKSDIDDTNNYLNSLDNKFDVNLSTVATQTTLSSFENTNHNDLVTIENSLIDIETDIETTNTIITNKTQYTQLTDGTNDVTVTATNRLRNSSTIVDGADESRKSIVTKAGQLQVSTFPPLPKVGTTDASQTVYDDISGTTDNVYTVPNGETLYITGFSAGSESSNIVELWYDPNGNGNNMEIIDVFFCNDNSYNRLENFSVVGDGTKAIRMRLINSGWGSVKMYAKWYGFF